MPIGEDDPGTSLHLGGLWHPTSHCIDGEHFRLKKGAKVS